MSDQKPNHEVEGVVRRAMRQDCVEAQIWEGYPKKKILWSENSCAVTLAIKPDRADWEKLPKYRCAKLVA